MTYTDVNIVQQLTEREQEKPYADVQVPCARQNGKTRQLARKEYRRRFGPIWGDIIWREMYFPEKD